MARERNRSRNRIPVHATRGSVGSGPLVETRGKVLVADDDRAISKALCLRLLQAGYEVETTHDGVSTTARAIDGHPDLLILDLSMPAGDGFSVLERLSTHPTTIGTPVIVLTASADPKLATEARARGATACFTKPYEWTELLAEIAAQLKQ